MIAVLKMIIELSELSDECILEMKKNQELEMSKTDNKQQLECRML